MQPQRCSCGSENLYRSPPIRSSFGIGGEGGDLLPRLTTLTNAATFTWVLCKDCGLGSFYAAKETREQLGTQQNGWSRLL